MSRWGKGRIISITCPTHGFVRGDHCERCREEKAYQGPTIHTFKPMVYTDICETPILISSKQQLREECKKHNVIAARLL